MGRSQVLAVIVVIGSVAMARADDAADVRAAAKRFFTDLGRSTPQQVLAQTDGYRAERDAVLAMDAVLRGQSKFVQACTRRFGSAADVSKLDVTYHARTAAGIDAAAVTIRGTHASVHDPGQKPSEGVRFENVAGAWKYHAATYPHTPEREVELARVAARGFDDTAAEVDAGVHPTFRSAVRACSRRLMQPTLESLFGSDLFDDVPGKDTPAKR